jgi:Spy/CpxP family protein refolding chaperone
MRYKKLLWVAGIVLVLVGTMAAAAGAQNRQMARKRQVLRNAVISKVRFAGLNLSQDQKEQIKSIVAGHKAEIIGLARETAAARKELAAALANGADMLALKAAYDKVSSAGWDRVQLRSKVQAEIKGVLTPEQLQKIGKRMQIRENMVKRLIKK